MRVLIVDDHPIILSGCRTLLGGIEDLEVFTAPDGERGFELFAEIEPNITILDFGLPGMSGIELLRRLLQRRPEARILMFSMMDDPVFVSEAISRGAMGFVSKNEDSNNLLTAIRTLVAGKIYLSADIAQKIAMLRIKAAVTTRPDVTPREREIVRLIAMGRSMSEVAGLINVSYKTVASSCAELRSKLNARTQMELVRIALLMGLC